MKKLDVRPWTAIADAVRSHPYICAAILCLLVEVFTFGDQSYISPQSVMILAVVSGVGAYMLLGGRIKNNMQPMAFSGCIIAAAALGAVFSMAEKKGAVVSALTAGCALVILGWLYLKKRLIPQNITRLVIFTAFGLYISYILYTITYLRQTDVNYWNSSSGHAAYIKYLFEHWFALPDFDPRTVWQFYHTPLFYYICAVLIRIQTFYGIEFEQAAEVSQVVTLYSAMSIVITSYKLFRLFGLKGKGLTAAVTVASLSNTIIILSGSISNDVTAAAFEWGAVYCAAKWYKSLRMKDILGCAVLMGLGMMTKLSGWMAAPAIAFLFVLVFIRSIKQRKNTGKYIGQYAAFLGVCAPLGLWFPFYNLIRWGVPLGYIPEGGENMYVGHKSIIERLFTASPVELSTPFLLQENFAYAYNPIVQLMKSSCDLQRFGAYKILSPLLTTTIITGSIIAFAAVIIMIVSLFNKKKKHPAALDVFLFIFWLTTFGSYMVFCIKYPFTCTENVRYVVPMIPFGALYFGRGADYNFRKPALTRLTGLLSGCAAGVYGIAAVITFVLLGFD